MASEKSPLNINKLVKNILTLATIALVVFLMWYFLSVTIYIVCGVILSLIARPLYILLERINVRKFKISGAINALLSIFLVWAVLGGIGALLFPIVIKEAVKVSKVDPEKLLKQMENPINNIVNEMEMIGLLDFSNSAVNQNESVKVIERTIVYKLPCDSIYNGVYYSGGIFKPQIDTTIKVSSSFTTTKKDSVVAGIVHRKEVEAMIKSLWTNYVSIQKVSQWFGSAFTFIGNLLATIVSASFLAFFFLRDKHLLKNMVLTLLPAKYEKQTLVIMTDSRKLLSRYFIGLVLELLLVMICTSIGLLIIGLRFDLAVTIGFFCGLFNVVPYLGPVIGGFVGLLLGISNHLEMDAYAVIFPLIIKMAIVFALVQVVDNNIFQTVIFSNSVHAHPIEIFLVIVIAGSLLGVLGMILAIPVYTFLRIIARQFLSQFKVIRSLTENM